MNHILMRSQKNDIVKILCEVGLDAYVSQLQWKDIESRFQGDIVSSLVCKHDNHVFYFAFHFFEDSFCPIYFPGDTINTVDMHGDDCCTWDATLSLVRKWAKRIKRELEAPDYWNDFAGIQSTFSLDTSAL